MRKLLPIPQVGSRFGRLVVVDNTAKKGRRKACRCRCDCGAEAIVKNELLVKGVTKSCGCYQRDASAAYHRIHGGKGTRLYTIWKALRQRCGNPNGSCHKNYHDRGIGVAAEWQDFTAFRSWALSHGYRDDLTIDRIDNDLGYSPDNCRWANRMEQNANRRNTLRVEVGGRKVRLADLSRESGIAYGTLYDRMSHGRPLTQNGKTKNKKKTNKENAK